MKADRRKRRPLRALIVVLAVAACGGPGIVVPRTATKLEILSGANQSGPVGERLTGKIVVRASDQQGPLAEVAITISTGGQGGGSVSPTRVTTGTTGEAEVAWTLGSALGTQTLQFTSAGVPPVSVTATGTVGTASLIFPVSDGFQFSVVSRAVTVIPRVRVTDIFGNPIPGVVVTFEADAGGSATGATPTTGDDGTATVGSWTIGPDALVYTLGARIAGGTVALFQAQGIPATLTDAGGNGQSANAGTAVATGPAVRAGRDDGTPLPGVSVSFNVLSGGGVIQGTPAITGADGIARASRWILGPTPGPNGAEGRTLAKDPVNFSATGIVGAPSNAVATTPTAQNSFFGNFVGTQPGVTVTDAAGNPVAGVPVTFQVSQGDGQLSGAVRTTAFDGRVEVGSWRLGNAASQAVQATGTGFPPVTFNATASAAPPSTLTIEVRFETTGGAQAPTPAQQVAFDQAVARWREILLSGDAPYPVNEPADPFGCFPAMNETVPGVVIFAELRAIDGPNGVIGQAGPCIVRDDPKYLSAVGTMQFDVADLALMESTGRLNVVILHEMAHVLGFGTLWNFLANQLLTGKGSSDPFFNGSAARGPFFSTVATGTTFTGNAVPVENTGGAGTRDSHWRRTTVTQELMIGFVPPAGVANPLSVFTAAHFRDMGYVVNDAAAEPFTFLAALQAMLAGPGFELREGTIPGPILVVDKRGRVVRRVPRQ